jgi:hypothetical protein
MSLGGISVPCPARFKKIYCSHLGRKSRTAGLMGPTFADLATPAQSEKVEM